MCMQPLLDALPLPIGLYIHVYLYICIPLIRLRKRAYDIIYNLYFDA